jgi:hypothetical protein
MERTSIAAAKRSLASLVVVTVSLMSSLVSSCEISCLFDDVQCAGVSTGTASPAQLVASISLSAEGLSEHARGAMRNGAQPDSVVRGPESASECGVELCKDASASAMLSAVRTEFRNVRSLALAVVRAANVRTTKCLSHGAESPPPRAAGASPPSTILRI